MNKKSYLIISLISLILVLVITIGVLCIPEKENKEINEYQKIDKEMYLIFDDTLYHEDNIGSVHDSELPKGVTVYVEECNELWCKVNYNDTEGYIQKNLLTEEEIKKDEVIEDPIEEQPPVEQPPVEEPKPEATMIPKNDIMYASTDANIRSSMDYGDNIVGVLKYNEPIERIGIIDKWSVVKYNNQECYVSTSILMANKIERKEINTNVKQDGSVDPTKPMVAITFDDGPGPTTRRILDTLAKYNVKATFFDVGRNMSRYPDIVKREAEIGEVGTHTYSHPNLNTLSIDALQNELNSAKKAYRDILGYDPKLIRPPYGNANANVKGLIPDMAIINWNIDTLDWKSRNADAVIDQVLRIQDLNGSIVLFHGIYESTADAIDYIVPYLINQGYQLVTVSELASYKGVQLTTGTIYHKF